ncbi:imelysin family protein [Parapusillimonas sp. JC17]|uniref:imelysin family protein n=1 Tax=Parapusillimonas sp. JC17 TaxID=3445768 RepID=UPI003F9FE225
MNCRQKPGQAKGSDPIRGLPPRRLASAAITAGLASLAVASACWAGTLPPQLGANLLRDYISPAMREFRDSARNLMAAVGLYCARPAQSSSMAVAKEFATLVGAWSHIEFLRFGPMMNENRYERIQFWPDPRGVVLRQVQAVLNGKQDLPDSEGLAKLSVALQGLPALEYVLYREHGLLSGQAAGRERSCRFAGAITGNLAAIGEALTTEWRADSEFGRQFVQPAPDRALYRSRQEVASEALKALSTGLQFGQTVKLQPVLGRDAAGATPRRAPFWRSGLAAMSQRAAIEGMRGFYLAGAYQYGDDEQWVDESVRNELQRAAEAFGRLPSPWDQAVNSDDGYRQLQLIALILKNAKSVVDEHMAPAFGVRIGFNALDGD